MSGEIETNTSTYYNYNRKDESINVNGENPYYFEFFSCFCVVNRTFVATKGKS